MASLMRRLPFVICCCLYATASVVLSFEAVSEAAKIALWIVGGTHLYFGLHAIFECLPDHQAENHGGKLTEERLAKLETDIAKLGDELQSLNKKNTGIKDVDDTKTSDLSANNMPVKRTLEHH